MERQPEKFIASPYSVTERARYAIEHGNSDQLHRDLLADNERLRHALEAQFLTIFFIVMRRSGL
ncbi:hypothetical protein [Mycobacterium marinum]|nr:hypothetical protein [Mycobacterium marinum]